MVVGPPGLERALLSPRSRRSAPLPGTPRPVAPQHSARPSQATPATDPACGPPGHAEDGGGGGGGGSGGRRGGLGRGRLRGRLREGAGERPGRRPLQGTGRDRRVLERGSSRERRRGARGSSSSMPVAPERKLSRRLGGRRPWACPGGGHRCHRVLRAGSAGLTGCPRAGPAARAEAGLREQDPRPRGAGLPVFGARARHFWPRGSGHVCPRSWRGSAHPSGGTERASPASHRFVTSSGAGRGRRATSVLAPQDGVRRIGEPRLRGAPAACRPAPLPPPGPAQPARSSPPASGRCLRSTCACLPT